MQKNIEYYMNLNYPIEIRKDPSAGYFVRIPDLPGCMSQGETKEEALEMIEDAKRSWIEVELEDGNPIPEPQEIEEYSGKILLRLPKSLHRKLAEQAAREKISLNQYIVSLLSEGAGIKFATSEFTTAIGSFMESYYSRCARVGFVFNSQGVDVFTVGGGSWERSLIDPTDIYRWNASSARIKYQHALSYEPREASTATEPKPTEKVEA